jgi:CheY-like chemotaxis protein
LSLPTAEARSVLIIDDDRDTIRLYRRWLQARDCVVRVARTPQQLETQLEQGIPDLVLLDVLMPQWDGWQVLQDFKARPETRGVPVVICSVISQPRLALSLGAAAVLRKPIDQAHLVESVEEHLAA